MRLVLLSLATLAFPAAAHEPAADPAKPVCRAIDAHAVTAPATATIRPLGQEPPARQIMALLHTEGGCQKPIVVRDGVGVAPQTSSTSRP